MIYIDIFNIDQSKKNDNNNMITFFGVVNFQSQYFVLAIRLELAIEIATSMVPYS